MIGTMKLFLFSLFLLSFQVEAQQICKAPVGETVDSAFAKNLGEIRKCVRNQFKRRRVNPSGSILFLNIESNFTIPLVGKDPYFGRVFITPGKNEIKYRDEKIAQKFMQIEKKNSASIYLTTYSTNDVNTKHGLSLVDAAGAKVVLTSPAQNFNSSKGGRLTASVQGPNGKPLSFAIDIEITPKKVQNFVILQGKRIAFDTIKVNAKDGLMGVSILNGVQNIQFMNGGKLMATATE